MESTIAEEFLNDFADLSEDEDLPQKKSKITEVEKIEKSQILASVELLDLISQIDSSSITASSLEKCNGLIVSISTEYFLYRMQQLHSYLRDLFYPRFPELEDLVPSILDFTNSVLILLDDNYNKKALEKCVGANIYIAIATSLIKSSLKPLPDPLLVRGVCEEILQLNGYYVKLLGYIQGKMQEIAPNLTQLVGSSVAANLISAAGNLEKLSVMPACNIQVLGLNRSNVPGMSNVSTFTSYLSKAPFVMQALGLTKKAIRMIAGKVALCARIDRFSEYKHGEKGKEMLKNIQESLEKASETNRSLLKKPLEVPKEITKPHRGGKRIRAAKKKFEISEVRKQMNRVEFGVNPQEEIRDTGFTLGMLGKTGKLKVKVEKNKHKLSAKTLAAAKAGTTSCFEFSSNHEIVLENPKMIPNTQSKFFESTKGFETAMSNKALR